MIIAYTRTYSNKQQSDNQKNAIEQFAANNNMTIDKWHKDTRTTSSRHKNRLEDIIKNMEAGDCSRCHTPEPEVDGNYAFDIIMY